MIAAAASSDVLYLDLCRCLYLGACRLPPPDVLMQTLQWDERDERDELYISFSILALSKNLQTAGVG